MGPKKRILLIDADDKRSSILAFVLKTRGFNVREAQLDTEAIMQAPEFLPAVVVINDSLASSHLECLRLIEEVSPGITSLLLSDVDPHQLVATQFSRVLVGEKHMANIVDAIRILAARKRGPMKGMHRKPVATEAISAALLEVA